MAHAELTDLIARASGLESCGAWRELGARAEQIAGRKLAELLDDTRRYRQFSRQACGLTLDYSRNLLTSETLEVLLQLADERDLGDWIGRLFDGSHVNNTEDRPALHMALRMPAGQSLEVDDTDIGPLVERERNRFLAFAEAVREGRHTGAGGGRIMDVVNIGIGGSDLGLVMLHTALATLRGSSPTIHFVSNIDGAQLDDVLARVRPDTTLFIICSKSFSTLETQLNAESARKWFLESQPEAALGDHFAAISVNDAAMDRFGIGADLRFRIWDWVGGRYSVWSAIGLSVAIGIGAEQFRALLNGAAAMDRHFAETPFADNLPVLLGLLGIWQINFLQTSSHAVLPYDQRLRYFPAFLQQLEMESNGKSVTRDGRPVSYPTGTVIWGEPGSNAQHSFFQLLHQGTARISMDFIAPVTPSSRFGHQHVQGLGNMLAQAEAFARGYPAESVSADLAGKGLPAADVARLTPHKMHAGNRSANILLFERLDPASLGALIALYEHKVFVQSVIWGINPFDQWGVELGKALAGTMSDALTGTDRGSALPPVGREIRSKTGAKPE